MINNKTHIIVNIVYLHENGRNKEHHTWELNNNYYYFDIKLKNRFNRCISLVLLFLFLSFLSFLFFILKKKKKEKNYHLSLFFIIIELLKIQLTSINNEPANAFATIREGLMGARPSVGFLESNNL